MAVEVTLPKMGESVAEATIIKWLKAVGDPIEEEESLVEIATDKVDSEVPSPATGILKEINFQEGDVASVGDIIAIIETNGGAALNESPKQEIPQAQPQSVAQVQARIEVVQEQVSKAVATTAPINAEGSFRFYSPLVKNIAKQEGMSTTELDSVPGSGKEGRVTKKDILSYISKRGSVPTSTSTQSAITQLVNNPAPSPKAAPKETVPAKSYGSDVEIIEMDRMRKLIADHMIMSKQTSPHVTSFVEADVTNLVKWRNRIKADFQAREGEKITFTPLFVEAVAKALKDYPMVNVSVDGSKIIRKKNINIGVATALPSGNLIVPVVKKADMLNLTGIAKTVNDLVGKARINKLSPDDIQDGTFTLTNVGTFGNLSGTPIINQPQVAILATGAIKKKPAVIETPEGDHIAIRHLMYLSLSYDHRVVDGALGGSFLRKVADYLEQFNINRDY